MYFIPFLSLNKCVEKNKTALFGFKESLLAALKVWNKFLGLFEVESYIRVSGFLFQIETSLSFMWRVKLAIF